MSILAYVLINGLITQIVIDEGSPNFLRHHMDLSIGFGFSIGEW